MSAPVTAVQKKNKMMSRDRGELKQRKSMFAKFMEGKVKEESSEEHVKMLSEMECDLEALDSMEPGSQWQLYDKLVKAMDDTGLSGKAYDEFCRSAGEKRLAPSGWDSDTPDPATHTPSQEEHLKAKQEQKEAAIALEKRAEEMRALKAQVADAQAAAKAAEDALKAKEVENKAKFVNPSGGKPTAVKVQPKDEDYLEDVTDSEQDNEIPNTTEMYERLKCVEEKADTSLKMSNDLKAATWNSVICFLPKDWTPQQLGKMIADMYDYEQFGCDVAGINERGSPVRVFTRSAASAWTVIDAIHWYLGKAVRAVHDVPSDTSFQSAQQRAVLKYLLRMDRLVPGRTEEDKTSFSIARPHRRPKRQAEKEDGDKEEASSNDWWSIGRWKESAWGDSAPPVLETVVRCEYDHIRDRQVYRFHKQSLMDLYITRSEVVSEIKHNVDQYYFWSVVVQSTEFDMTGSAKVIAPNTLDKMNQNVAPPPQKAIANATGAPSTEWDPWADAQQKGWSKSAGSKGSPKGSGKGKGKGFGAKGKKTKSKGKGKKTYQNWW